MSSRSSSDGGRRIRVGRVAGRRGNAGELTVRIDADDAPLWRDLTRVRIGDAWYAVEGARSYRDRLVLKLESVDDAGAAQALRGATVEAERDALPPLEEDEYLADDLIGLDVVEGARSLGRVRGLIATGGADVLEVDGPDGRELLVPLARGIVRRVDRAGGRIEVELPEGLEELNRTDSDG